ncbi:MAG: hypothetical protein M1812_004638 [Candelaria pacifica]|nr:MAG: hypothetical protein M1812_004638 [Candelaria pacifica]
MRRKREAEESFAAKRARFEEEVTQDARRNGKLLSPFEERSFSFARNASEFEHKASELTSAPTQSPDTKLQLELDRRILATRGKSQRLENDEKRMSRTHGEENHDTHYKERTYRGTPATLSPVEIKDSYEDPISNLSEVYDHLQQNSVNTLLSWKQESDDVSSRARRRVHSHTSFLSDSNTSSKEASHSSSGGDSDDRSKMSKRQMKKLKKAKSSKARHLATSSHRQASPFSLVKTREKIRKLEEAQNAKERKTKLKNQLKDTAASDEIRDIFASDEELTAEFDHGASRKFHNTTGEPARQAPLSVQEDLIWNDEGSGSSGSNHSSAADTEYEPQGWEGLCTEEPVAPGKVDTPASVEQLDVEDAMRTFLDTIKSRKHHSISISKYGPCKIAQDHFYEDFEKAARKLHIDYIKSRTLDDAMIEEKDVSASVLDVAEENARLLAVAKKDDPTCGIATAKAKCAELALEIKFWKKMSHEDPAKAEEAFRIVGPSCPIAKAEMQHARLVLEIDRLQGKLREQDADDFRAHEEPDFEDEDEGITGLDEAQDKCKESKSTIEELEKVVREQVVRAERAEQHIVLYANKLAQFETRLDTLELGIPTSEGGQSSKRRRFSDSCDMHEIFSDSDSNKENDIGEKDFYTSESSVVKKPVLQDLFVEPSEDGSETVVGDDNQQLKSLGVSASNIYADLSPRDILLHMRFLVDDLGTPAEHPDFIRQCDWMMEVLRARYHDRYEHGALAGSDNSGYFTI